MKKPSEILLAARELVARPGGWTTGAYAKDSKGSTAAVNESDAVCFCTLGAIGCVSSVSREYDRSLELFRAANGIKSGVAGWNDSAGRTQLDVVLAFERAALAAMKAGE